MGFKEWLLSEDAGASSAGDDFFYGLQLYPSDAFDYAYSTINPAEQLFLQNRWKLEKGQGRKMINIDYSDFIGRTYTSVGSKGAPGVEEGFWRHKEDNPNEGDLRVTHHTKLQGLGVGKNAANPVLLGAIHLNPNFDVDLDGIFGDKAHAGPVLKDDFDRPWTRVYENITPYDVIGPGTIGVNVNMGPGIRSKFVTDDEVNPYDAKLIKLKTAKFGFKKKKKDFQHLLP